MTRMPETYLDAAHDHGALLCVDACQTVGRLPVDMAALGADLLAASSHKCYGPPGTGFLVVGGQPRLRPVLLGDERERRRRAGMENLPGVAAMGAITHGSVRVSFLRDATGAEVDRLLEVLPAAVAELREMADLDSQTLDRVSTEGSGEPRGVPR